MSESTLLQLPRLCRQPAWTAAKAPVFGSRQLGTQSAVFTLPRSSRVADNRIAVNGVAVLVCGRLGINQVFTRAHRTMHLQQTANTHVREELEKAAPILQNVFRASSLKRRGKRIFGHRADTAALVENPSRSPRPAV